jgi:signal transduction histidine kinase
MLAELKHQTISLDVPAADLLVRVDRVRLSQAVQNVIGNAVKFTPEGGHVSVGVDATVAEACIRVTDSGVGISARDLGNIFRLFYRAPEQGAAPRGFGIGLALARRVVEIHRGTISARSAGAGQGASFTIALPLAAPGEAA